MTKSTSILLVDDNPVICRAMSSFLENEGHFVTVATNGVEALDQIRTLRPDLIISDLRMPELDGLQLLKIVKAEFAETPFVIISGEGTMEDAIEGLRLGAWDYLIKPVYPLELLRHCVDKVLERVRLITEAHYYRNFLEETVEKRTADLLEQNNRLALEVTERQNQEQLTMTAMAELEKAFKEKEILQSQLLQAHKLESVGQLASGIAHEINTPTQFVSSNVSFLDEAFSDISDCVGSLTRAAEEERLSADLLDKALAAADWPYLQEEIPKAIKQSREGLARVTSIVRAMKEFSHPGGQDTEQSDINHLIETTVTVARNEWKYSAEVVLNLAPDLPRVACLDGAIGQVLLNLLVNAAQTISEKIGRTPAGGKGTITITTENDDSAVLVHIADTGCGIPEECRGKIFEPFFTTKEVGKGTGQGLAIAYDVITHKHGGSLTFSTVIGEGTTFTIRLPIAEGRTPLSPQELPISLQGAVGYKK
jgi:signal transduction histidine kinase